MNSQIFQDGQDVVNIYALDPSKTAKDKDFIVQITSGLEVDYLTDQHAIFR